jgi:hypothetical protein
MKLHHEDHEGHEDKTRISFVLFVPFVVKTKTKFQNRCTNFALSTKR